jgi:hypothetical protein
MTTDTSLKTTAYSALPWRVNSSERKSPLTLPAMRERQRAKIREFGDALAAMGLRTLDKQADALALSLAAPPGICSKHKGSGISPTIINRMLASPRLPPRVRAKIIEYVAEKAAGAYGDSKARLNKFTTRVSGNALAHGWPGGIEQRKRSTKLPHK